MHIRQKMKANLKYFIYFVDFPIACLIKFWASRYPDLVEEEINNPNALILFRLMKEFPEHWDFWGKSFFHDREKVFMGLIKLVIIKYLQSPSYRNVLDWFFYKMNEYGWKPWTPTRQMRNWRG